MNTYVAVFSFFVGCLVCLPLFKYLLSAVSSNSTEFLEGCKKLKNRDPIEDEVPYLGNYSAEDSFTTANFVVLLLPCIPATLLAVPLYFLILWFLGLFGV